MIALRAMPEARVPLSTAVLLAGAGAVGAAAVVQPTAVAALLGLVVLAGVLCLAWRASLIEPRALLLVGLLSANYNVFINANAFIAGGTDRGRLITMVATGGLALFALVQNERRRAHGIPFRAGLTDALFGALLLMASIAFLLGAQAGNPRTYLVGDYGQLLQVVAAYAAIRLFSMNAGPEGTRAFLVLLGATWGLRAAAELLFPEARGTAIIVLDGERLFRRTDPLGPLALPLLLGLTLGERRPERAVLLSGSLALIAVQNVLGFTRAHYVAIGAALALLLLASFGHAQARGRLLKLLPALAAATIALYIALPPFRATVADASVRFFEAFDPTTQSRLHREAENDAVLDYIRAAPLAGRGLGAEYVGVDADTLRPRVTHFIHNDYLALWMRGGVLLAGTWVTILGCAIWRGLARGGALGRPTSSGAAAGVFGVAVTAVLSGSAFGYVAGPITALLVVVATWRPGEGSLPDAVARGVTRGSGRAASLGGGQ